MSSSSETDKERKRSYEDDSFETAEESILADHRSSPIVWGRRESVFLAESSSASSAEELSPAYEQPSITESYETTPVVNSSGSESTITEERDYSDQFESFANFSEEESSIEDETISETKVQEDFISKKLAVLSSSHESGSKTQNCEKRDEDKTVDGHQEMNNYCSRKLKIVEMSKQEVPGSGYGKRRVFTTGGQLHTSQDPPIDGNKRKIESLRIENLMNRTEKLKEQDFHNPRHCSDCRKMKSSISSNTFLKRKLEVAKTAEFEERLQFHMYQKDSATLLAEIVNSCTKATTPPSEVWEKLLHKDGKK